MRETKILAISREKIAFLTKLVALLSVAVIVPLFHQQMITGPVVNATLFVATAVLGVSGGILVGLIPGVIALSVGLLPPVLAPMIPFIMISNTILVLTFHFLKDKNYWWGIIMASVLKFVFLYGTSSVVISLLLKKEVAEQVSLMMSWPQLLTALAGGCLAYGIIKWGKI
ncbi:MAG: iron hydrogenase [Candidatus Moranbacteria bacterium CG_4_9_14_3_um_filter_40_7]|nr:MAG: iron hydrogenase [Candidatus Moranbacteria bacterium CG23_combo_of_CG06-09_8_20_14_all_40_16]PIU80473.1 MAG: iron hydrogenase [Candidatus Moranbacteria bacterium CG06_land_8_20_14_3_00_40_12]PJA88005.1 MAG: iron hydrogenase [Candidatus Moranbacteria bacterium CG_4_9_14_3_um_filter_40_7]